MRFRPDRRNRPRRRGLLGGLLAGPLMPALTEANRLWDAGQLVEAGQRFSDLAQQAGQAGQFRRAVQFHVRAGEAYAQAKDGQHALAEARAALAWLKRAGRDRRAGKLGWRIVDGLRAVGLNAEADELQRELTGVVGAPEPEPAPVEARGRLPARCSQCGAPLRGDEVEWIDAQSAECAYCGSTIAAE